MLKILLGIVVYCISLIILKDTSTSIAMQFLTNKIFKKDGGVIDITLIHM